MAITINNKLRTFDYLFLTYNSALLIVYTYFFEFYIVLNILMVSIVLFFTSKFQFNYLFKKKNIKLRWANKSLAVYLLFSIFLFIIFNKNIRGWQSVLSTSFIYYTIFIVYWSNTRRINLIRSKPWENIISFVLGFYVFSKVLILSSLIMISVYIKSQKNLGTKFYQIIFIGLFFVLILYFNNIEYNNFLSKSLFRDDFDKDTKILGLSDGMRMSLWSDYLGGSVLFGRGYSVFIDTISSHNIVVYSIYEFGWIGSFFVLIPLCLAIYKNLKDRNYLYLVLFLICVSLSSFFEYASIWIPSLLILPILLSNRIRSEK